MRYIIVEGAKPSRSLQKLKFLKTMKLRKKRPKRDTASIKLKQAMKNKFVYVRGVKTPLIKFSMPLSRRQRLLVTPEERRDHEKFNKVYNEYKKKLMDRMGLTSSGKKKKRPKPGQPKRPSMNAPSLSKKTKPSK